MNLDFCDACEISTGKFGGNRFRSRLKRLLYVTHSVLNCVARDTKRPYMNLRVIQNIVFCIVRDSERPYSNFSNLEWPYLRFVWHRASLPVLYVILSVFTQIFSNLGWPYLCFVWHRASLPALYVILSVLTQIFSDLGWPYLCFVGHRASLPALYVTQSALTSILCNSDGPYRHYTVTACLPASFVNQHACPNCLCLGAYVSAGCMHLSVLSCILRDSVLTYLVPQG